MEAIPSYPRLLEPVRGPLPDDLVERCVRSLEPGAAASRELVQAGIVPPSVLTAMSLFLLAGQPRAGAGAAPTREGAKGDAVAGGIWVREQITVHRPLHLGETIEVTGEMPRRWTRRGRRFSTTTSETRGADGRLIVTSHTTGLTQYRRDPALADSAEGRAESEVVHPGPDASVAADNPAAEGLRALRTGDRLDAAPLEVTLASMRARDGEDPRNPIHSDPEAARRAGLDAPIAAGAQVLGYVQERLMEAWGRESLLHGAHFDVRWVSPVRAGARVATHARVTAASPGCVDLDLEVACGERQAMVGTLAIPRSRRDAAR